MVSADLRTRSYVFFFSSRRRHTRCSRDWSSDVCSSDLLLLFSWRGCLFRVGERVQPPKAGSLFFCRHLPVRAGERVLEIGSGLGLASVLAARAGAHVVATDIVPEAVEAIRGHATLNGVS